MKTLVIAVIIVVVLFFVALFVIGAKIGADFNNDIRRDEYVEDLYGAEFTKEAKENDGNANKLN